MREIKVEPIRVIERTIQVLNCFRFDCPTLTIDSIVKETGFAKATVYRMLWTLEKNGLVYYDRKENTYQLGYKFLEYGGIVQENLDLRKEAEPILSELYQEVGHTVLFSIRYKDVNQYLLSYERKDEFQPISYTGRNRVIHYGALGILLMSYLPITEVEKILRKNPLVKLTPFTKVDEGEFYQRLKQIRKQGYFIDVDETFVGFTGIAVPVFGYNGEVPAAIGVAGPSFKLEGREKEIIRLMKKAASAISEKIQYASRI